jgi:hypothetical protein
MSKPFPSIRNAPIHEDSLVLTAVRWASDGRLDENVEDENVVLDLLWSLDSLCEGGGWGCQASLSVEREIEATLVATKSYVVKSLRGTHLEDCGEALDECDWNNAMPVIDSDLKLTGDWIYWDVTDNEHVNYRDTAAISVEDARIAGLAIEDGYALSQEGR